MPRLVYSSSFRRDFRKLPPRLQESVQEHIARFLADRSHPSLRLKKMGGYEDVWEIRISHGYRITLSPSSEEITFHRVGPHDITRRLV